jgi:hypothetical protein
MLHHDPGVQSGRVEWPWASGQHSDLVDLMKESQIYPPFTTITAGVNQPECTVMASSPDVLGQQLPEPTEDVRQGRREDGHRQHRRRSRRVASSRKHRRHRGA